MLPIAVAAFCLSLVAVSGQNVRQFNYYTLAVQHGAGYCYKNSVCTKLSKVPQYPDWTIHGLWPSNVAFCGAHRFFPSQLTELTPTLRRTWPSFTRRDDASFWRYQFAKHGSCAIGSPKIDSVSAYFRKTVELYEDFVGRVLRHFKSQAGPLDVRRLEQLFRNSFGKSVRITCRKNVGSLDVLAEIRVCYSRSTLEAIDCPGKSSCSAQAYFAGNF